MSFILDALQRAQKAHDQPAVQAAPILADQVPDAPANLHRRLLWLALALLGAASIALAAWWLGRESVTPAAPAQTRTETTTAPPAPVATTRPADRAPVRALDQEIARATPTRASTSAANTTPDTDIQQAVDAGATLIKPRARPDRGGSVTITPGGNAADAARSTTPAVPATTPDPGENLPQYENLLLNGKINLPNLKMDMHVFNQRPEKRFVFVNFKKYREGDKLDGNTIVEQITGNGAVLNHQGQRFLLRPN